MKTTQLMLAALCVTVLATGAWAQLGPETESTLAALKQYKFGEDRSCLAAVSDALSAAKSDAAKAKALEEGLLAILSGEAGVDAKNFVCRELVVYGTAASVPVLAGLLQNPEVAATAFWALENIPGQEASDALIQAAAASAAPVRLAAAQSLGRRGLAEPLGGMLNDADESVAVAAANALGKAGSEAALALITAKRASAAGALRAALDCAALECADKQAAAGKEESALAIYGELLAPGSAAHVRSGALGGLIKAKPEQALEQVLAALADPDAAFAGTALGFVSQLPGEAATRAFAQRLLTLDADGQTRLLQVLQARGDAAALQEVTGLAASPDENVQLAVLDALGVLGNADSVGLLCEKAANSAPKLSRAAQASMDQLNTPGINDALAKLAQQGSAEIRAEAVAALGRRKAGEKSQDVLKLTRDKNDRVRSEALKALRAIGGPGDLLALLDQLTEQEFEADRPGIQAAAVAICQRGEAGDLQVMPVMGRLSQAKEPKIQAALLGILGQVPVPASLRALQDALKGSDALVRKTAIELMGQWPDGGTIENLRAVLDAPKNAEEASAVSDAMLQALKNANALPAAARAEHYRVLLLKAQDEALVKRVLSGLAALPCIEAMELVQEAAQNPAFATEGNLAALRIATDICGAYPDAARKAAEVFLKEGADPRLKQQAESIVGRLNCAQGFITAWELSGPYFAEGKSAYMLFSEKLLPETAPETAAWRIVPMSDNPDQCWSVDLAKLFDGSERVVYLRTVIESPQAQEAVLAVGSNDDCKVWLNGTQIHAYNEGRALVQDNDKVPVQLNQGRNELMLAVYQRSGAWGLCARVLGKDGQPLGGLSYSLNRK